MSPSATSQTSKRPGGTDPAPGPTSTSTPDAPPGAAPQGSVLRAWLAVAGLALGVFSFVTTETLPIGLLPSIADGTSVSLGTAGFLVTGFAALAAVTAAPLTALTGRVDRKWLLVALMVLYIAGNLMAAVVDGYALLLTARLIVALAHGVFWSIAVSIAVRLVPERHAVRATSVVLGGISSPPSRAPRWAPPSASPRAGTRPSSASASSASSSWARACSSCPPCPPGEAAACPRSCTYCATAHCASRSASPH